MSMLLAPGDVSPDEPIDLVSWSFSHTYSNDGARRLLLELVIARTYTHHALVSSGGTVRCARPSRCE